MGCRRLGSSLAQRFPRSLQHPLGGGVWPSGDKGVVETGVGRWVDIPGQRTRRVSHASARSTVRHGKKLSSAGVYAAASRDVNRETPVGPFSWVAMRAGRVLQQRSLVWWPYPAGAAHTVPFLLPFWVEGWFRQMTSRRTCEPWTSRLPLLMEASRIGLLGEGAQVPRGSSGERIKRPCVPVASSKRPSAAERTYAP